MPGRDKDEKVCSGSTKRRRVESTKFQRCKKCHFTQPSLDATNTSWLQDAAGSSRARCLTPSLRNPNTEGNSVLCLLQRDLRLQDNWALLFAQDVAITLGTPLHVLHLVVPGHTFQRTSRHVDFHLKGLEEFAAGLAAHNISFHCHPVVQTDAVAGLREAGEQLKKLVVELKPRLAVCDLMPLRLPTELVNQATEICQHEGRCPLYQIDAHNVVPVWLASDKQEYSARTFRPRVMRLLSEFGCEFPRIKPHPISYGQPTGLSFSASDILEQLKADNRVQLPHCWRPGATAGLKAMKVFCTVPKLLAYTSRNNPVLDSQSGLSPWLHFGQISAQRCLASVKDMGPATKIGATTAAARESYIEELVVRRELAENFTFYNSKYNQITGAPIWAQETLAAHKNDKREHLYALEQLEGSKTHDELWNAAQLQLVHTAKMHGFLRMYWAKKILEWTPSADIALTTALFLNDKFSLDGTDPNGVVGCMWSVAGVHDQGWAERPIFGKIRYMNLAGCMRKFSVDAFVRCVRQIVGRHAKKGTKNSNT
ncbi:DNA photolyase, putative [Eimeria tenella]|uniref:Deoxyribodipyrimidine photo-lyase n=1 Tax=Eimeria tenella TaxID=5802 RepID=U6KGF9_EIMTE|nr:DNA photolyase, putative [Eimeria tenella]CDJ37039.1 DNA photolyase, putative [Eimeria tenella]|eukprot:XP_013227877.1 DNA photolyase, putative [Eimeria tenella]